MGPGFELALHRAVVSKLERDTRWSSVGQTEAVPARGTSLTKLYLS